MKSERAENYLYDHECSYPYSGYVTMQDAERMAGLAEQETEERMREKAIEAFKSSCKYKDGCDGSGRVCDPALCEDLRSFIQKLDEILKAIKERAKKYARKVWRGGTREYGSHMKLTECDFIAGAQSDEEARLGGPVRRQDLQSNDCHKDAMQI